MDCDGHGTSVAAVAAGPPASRRRRRIVAIKVVKGRELRRGRGLRHHRRRSTSPSRTRRTYSHRRHQPVLRRSADGRTRRTDTATTSTPSTCRRSTRPTRPGSSSSSPPGTRAHNAIAAPACISTAVSVGAVYPDTFAYVPWSDDSGGTLARTRRWPPTRRLLLQLRHQSVAARARRLLERRDQGRRRRVLRRHVRGRVPPSPARPPSCARRGPSSRPSASPASCARPASRRATRATASSRRASTRWRPSSSPASASAASPETPSPCPTAPAPPRDGDGRGLLRHGRQRQAGGPDRARRPAGARASR